MALPELSLIPTWNRRLASMQLYWSYWWKKKRVLDARDRCRLQEWQRFLQEVWQEHPGGSKLKAVAKEVEADYHKGPAYQQQLQKWPQNLQEEWEEHAGAGGGRTGKQLNHQLHTARKLQIDPESRPASFQCHDLSSSATNVWVPSRCRRSRRWTTPPRLNKKFGYPERVKD